MKITATGTATATDELRNGKQTGACIYPAMYRTRHSPARSPALDLCGGTIMPTGRGALR